MKAVIVYSSLTGNTKLVAEAILEAFREEEIDCDIYSIKEAPSLEAYDLICAGYWVDKGLPDAKCKSFMQAVTGKKIALFGTLGAYPDSEHGKSCINKGEEIAVNDGKNEVIGTYICMGRVDPKVIEVMQRMAKDQHPMTDERKARIEEGKKHPDADDLAKAKVAFKAFIKELK